MVVFGVSCLVFRLRVGRASGRRPSAVIISLFAFGLRRDTGARRGIVIFESPTHRVASLPGGRALPSLWMCSRKYLLWWPLS